MKLYLLAAAIGLLPVQSQAQAPAVPPAAPPSAALRTPPSLPYGMPISLEQAKKVTAAVEAEIARRKLATVSFAIVEPTGEIVMYQKATAAPYAAWDLAVSKARSAARLTRPTSFDGLRLANGQTFILAFADVYPTAGGVPIIIDGRVIGAIGVTGGADEVLAQLGADSLK